MPRIRTIKPEFWQNEQIAGLREHARLLAIALLNHADDTGCFVASHQLVRAACFPFEEDSKNVLGSLQDLSRIGYIEVRNCSGKQIGRICKFLDHQRIDKPQKSKLFDVFAANCEENSDSKNVPGTFLEDSGNVQRLERKGKEREREVDKGMEGISTEPEEPASVPYFDQSSCVFPTLPCSGDTKTWEATDMQLTAWQQAYPGIDVHAEHRKAHSWVMANLSKRKTCGGYPKFINSWMARTQDSGGANVATKPQQKTFAQLKQENTDAAFKRVFGDDAATAIDPVVEGTVRRIRDGSHG
jgi:hypothetical protein